MALHPDFIAETECGRELNAYMEALIDRHAPGSVIFNSSGEVLYPFPAR